jgi:acyl-CoA reductase-like NAD-dependent aldehyde dehydrogenase
MTGSTGTGQIIAAAAAPRLARLHLELGSNNAAIIRADADVVSAAKAVVDGALKLSGQWCEAPRRIVVDSTVIGDFTNAVHSELANWTIGSSLDDRTQLGPVAFRGRLDHLRSQREALRDSGHQIITVGRGRALDRSTTGWFFEPTIALGSRAQVEAHSSAYGSRASSAEIFGPMVVIEPSFGDAEAVRRANEGQVGLAAYVFSADEDAARAIGIQLDAGEVKINGTSVLDMAGESSQSFFGSSGIGGHGDADLLSFFTGKRIVGTDRPGLPL